MSMINDALRRASNASRVASEVPSAILPAPITQPPPLPRSEGQFPSPPPMHGAEDSLPPELVSDEDSESGTGKKHLLRAILLLVCIGGAAGFGIWKQKSRAKAKTVAALPATKPILPDAHVRRASSNAVEAALANVSTRPVAAPAPVAATTQPSVAAPLGAAAPSAIKFPSLRLQSIFYRPSNPSVLINGKTLYVTDEIQGVLVADIQPASVTLVLSGQTNVLTLR